MNILTIDIINELQEEFILWLAASLSKKCVYYATINECTGVNREVLS